MLSNPPADLPVPLRARTSITCKLADIGRTGCPVVRRECAWMISKICRRRTNRSYGSARRLELHLVLERGLDEPVKERMRLVRLGEELRVELAREEVGMVLQLDEFGKIAVG